MGGTPSSNREKRGLGKPETFDFLGFTFYCGQDAKKTFFRVKVKSSKKKVISKLKKMNEWIKVRRHWTIKDIVDSLNRSLRGYFNYYCVSDNIPFVQRFRFRVITMLYRWLNRRSQKKSYNWQQFYDLLKTYPIVEAKLKVCLWSR